jgi:hypothetical protein
VRQIGEEWARIMGEYQQFLVRVEAERAAAREGE